MKYDSGCESYELHGKRHSESVRANPVLCLTGWASVAVLGRATIWEILRKVQHAFGSVPKVLFIS